MWLCPVLTALLQVIHITGRLRLRVSLSHGRTIPSQIMGLVVVAHALPPPTINEVRIDCHMFVTRVNMDLNIIYCENRYLVFVSICPAVFCTLVRVGVFSRLQDFTLPGRLIINPDLIFNGCLDWYQTWFFYLKCTLLPWFALGITMEWIGIPRHLCAIIKAHFAQQSRERARLRHYWENDAVTSDQEWCLSQTLFLTHDGQCSHRQALSTLPSSAQAEAAITNHHRLVA